MIAAWTGNHGQSVAYAADLFGVRAVVCMPEQSNPVKVESMRALGAEVVFHRRDFDEAREHCETGGRPSTGYRYIHSGSEPALHRGGGHLHPGDHVAGIGVVVHSGERVDLVWTVPSGTPAGGAWTVACHIPGDLVRGMQIPHPLGRPSPLCLVRANGWYATGSASRHDARCSSAPRRILDGLRDRRAVHRRARRVVCVYLPGGLHPFRRGRRTASCSSIQRVHRLRRLRTGMPGQRDLPRGVAAAGMGELTPSTRPGSPTRRPPEPRSTRASSRPRALTALRAPARPGREDGPVEGGRIVLMRIVSLLPSATE